MSLADPFEQLLREHCTSQQVRALENGAAVGPLWQHMLDSGFVDALVPEAQGGAGLPLREVFELVELCGKYAVPLPVAQSMLARALLAHGGVAAPSECIALATAQQDATGAIVCRRVPYADSAHWVLVELDQELRLLATADAQREPIAHRSSAADLRWPAQAKPVCVIARRCDLLIVQAALMAAQLAGAMGKAFQMTLEYANQRVQFGRNIGKFQAIQHQISVMAEQSALARAAAQLAFDAESHLPRENFAAMAKAAASEAAVSVAAIAHAVHAAIGMTAEFDLQLYTRRLHEWRWCAGAESYWHARVGSSLLQQSVASLDFIRT